MNKYNTPYRAPDGALFLFTMNLYIIYMKNYVKIKKNKRSRKIVKKI